MDYRIYEHIVGLPDYLDTPMEELEECLAGYSAEEAQTFITKYVPSIDKYGRKRNVYIKEHEGS